VISTAPDRAKLFKELNNADSESSMLTHPLFTASVRAVMFEQLCSIDDSTHTNKIAMFNVITAVAERKAIFEHWNDAVTTYRNTLLSTVITDPQKRADLFTALDNDNRKIMLPLLNFSSKAAMFMKLPSNPTVERTFMIGEIPLENHRASLFKELNSTDDASHTNKKAMIAVITSNTDRAKLFLALDDADDKKQKKDMILAMDDIPIKDMYVAFRSWGTNFAVTEQRKVILLGIMTTDQHWRLFVQIPEGIHGGVNLQEQLWYILTDAQHQAMQNAWYSGAARAKYNAVKRVLG
jgi:hypothetical protein